MNTKQNNRLKTLFISLLLTLTMAACGVSQEIALEENPPVNIIQGDTALKSVTPTPVEAEVAEAKQLESQEDTESTTSAAQAVISSSDDQSTTKQSDEGAQADSAMAAEVILTYERSGGYAGRTETWTIFSDGNVLNSKGKMQLGNAKAITNILNQAENAEFFNLEKVYMPKNTCCDRFTHVLTIHTKGETHQVTTLDDAPNTPDSLWELLESVQEYIQETTESGS